MSGLNSLRRKIVFIIDEYTPGAGTENQIRGILRHLDRARFEAILVTLRKPVTPEDQQDLGWPVKCLGVHRLLHITSIHRFLRFVWWLRRTRVEVAMIYFQDSRLFAVPACRLGGVRSIISNRRDMGYWRTHTLSRALRMVDRLSHRCLVNSQAVKRSVEDYEHYPGDRITVIYNALWNDVRTEAAIVTKSRLGLENDTAVVGIVANLRPVKRVDRFLEMAAMVVTKVPKVHFLVLGCGNLEGTLKEQTDRFGLAHCVSFLGKVEDVGSYLSIFDVGVLTSESEGLSNSLIEYAAAGVPAVAFDAGGNSEVIADNVTGFLVPQGDIPGLASKVVAILSDNVLRRRMSTESRNLVMRRFSPDTIMRELMAFWGAIS